jgi:4-hydroxybenzoate polyprenyltransferase
MRRALAIINGLIRPPFAILLALDAALGMVQTCHLPSVAFQVVALVAVAAWMLFAVAVNDLADERIDRVNLRDDARRVLVSGHATRTHVVAIALGSGIVAFGAAIVLGWASVVVIGSGLALAAAYSLPPFRLSGRGALTSALLPLGYVTVPYLVGAFSAGATVHKLNPVLLAGMYLGFMGRLALKDFRDERGDRLYGKRTTLVRHGRTHTCLFSAVFWSAGAIVALGGLPSRLSTTAAMVAYMVVVVAMLADIAHDENGLRDVANIAAIATVGRALVYTAIIQLVTNMNRWSILSQNLVVAGIAIASLGMAWECRRSLLLASSALQPEGDRRELRPAALPAGSLWSAS